MKKDIETSVSFSYTLNNARSEFHFFIFSKKYEISTWEYNIFLNLKLAFDFTYAFFLLDQFTVGFNKLFSSYTLAVKRK